MPIFQRARFFTTVNHLRDLPREARREVAFAGRSNAGKSSAINTLANHTRLAFTSKTPGRTQHINYFELGDGDFLVDLPGYGFAKVPDDVRAHWEKLLGNYLQRREALVGLVIIMDARRPLTPVDRHMLDWFAPTGRPVHVLLSKSDKLTRQECTTTLRKVKSELSAWGEQITVQLFSSLKKTGVEEAEKIIGTWLCPLPAPAPE